MLMIIAAGLAGVTSANASPNLAITDDSAAKPAQSRPASPAPKKSCDCCKDMGKHEEHQAHGTDPSHS